MIPKVSIIVPVYNVEKYLEKCLESICSQTLKDIEVIVVNDGTEDNSQDIIDTFVQRDSRIISVIKENSGVSAARNAGIQVARGKYIGFIDSDDSIDQKMFETLYHAIEKKSADLVACGFKAIFPDNRAEIESGISDSVFNLKETGLDNFLLNQLGSISIVPWNKLYRKEIIDKNNLKFLPRSKVYSEDFLFIICYTLFCNKICTLEQPMYHYLIREGSLMHTPHTGQHKKLVNLATEFNEVLKKIDKQEEVNLYSNALMLDIATRSLYSVRGHKRSLQRVLKELDENPAYRRKLKAVLDSNISKIYKLKAYACLIKPYWIASLVIRALFVMKYRK